jgi:hypothetical protein
VRVRGLLANEIAAFKLTPHPNPLPQGERESSPLTTELGDLNNSYTHCRMVSLAGNIRSQPAFY